MTTIGTIYDIFVPKHQKNIKENEINKTDNGKYSYSKFIKIIFILTTFIISVCFCLLKIMSWVLELLTIPNQFNN